MKLKALISVLFLVGIFCLRSYSQSCSLPAGAQYSNEIAPWAPGTQAFISFDPNGAGTGDVHTFGIQITPDPSNARPKFTLNQNINGGLSAEDQFVNGAMDWNNQNGADGTGVAFHQGSTTNSGGNWIVSATWPKATVNYIASDGNVHTLPVDFTGVSAAAATQLFARLGLFRQSNEHSRRCGHPHQHEWHIPISRRGNFPSP